MAPEAISPKAAEEMEQRQREALQTVQTVARLAGDTLPFVRDEQYGFDGQPGIYLLGSESEEVPQEMNFGFEKKMVSGAANSAHAVLAGNLTAEYQNHGPREISIAAKCYRKREFEDRLERAAKEVTISQDMRRRGELSLDPVAVAVTPRDIYDGAVVIFTRFEDNLYTFDNNPWGRGPTAQNTQTAVIAAETLGRFNTYGYKHGDSRIKNVASVPGSRPGMIDFETSERFDLTDPFAAASAAHVDLDLLLDSLKDSGMFELRRSVNSFQDNSIQIADSIRAICEAYVSSWENASPEVQGAVYETVIELGQRVMEKTLPIPQSV